MMTNLPRLTHSDRGWLLLATLAVTATAFVSQSPAGLNEALAGHSLTESRESGAWLIPTIGGTAWSDASPLTHWIAGVFLPLTGNDPILALRASGLLGLIFAALFTADLAALCGGRRLGLLAGGILLTTFGLTGDIVAGGHHIWLAAASTGVLRLLTAIESESRHARSRAALAVRRESLVSSRSYQMLSLFVLVACVSVGTDLISIVAVLFVPLAGWLLMRGWSAARKYVWVWGLTATLAVITCWLLAIDGQVVGTAYLWQRLTSESLTGWSPSTQLIELASCTLPWGLLIPVGLWATRDESLGDANSRERLISTYAVLCPLSVLVLRPLHTTDCLAAAGTWSVLAAIGLDSLMQWTTLRLNLVDSRPLQTQLRRAAVGTAAMMAAVQVQSDATVECQVDVNSIAAQIRGNAAEGAVVSLSAVPDTQDGETLITLRSDDGQESEVSWKAGPDDVRVASEPINRN